MQAPFRLGLVRHFRIKTVSGKAMTPKSVTPIVNMLKDHPLKLLKVS